MMCFFGGEGGVGAAGQARRGGGGRCQAEQMAAAVQGSDSETRGSGRNTHGGERVGFSMALDCCVIIIV
ncbi:unnamed protein product [Arctogadus glacialis]